MDNLEARIADSGGSKVLRWFCGMFDPSVFVNEGEMLNNCLDIVSEHLNNEDLRDEHLRFRKDIITNHSKVANDINDKQN